MNHGAERISVPFSNSSIHAAVGNSVSCPYVYWDDKNDRIITTSTGE